MRRIWWYCICAGIASVLLVRCLAPAAAADAQTAAPGWDIRTDAEKRATVSLYLRTHDCMFSATRAALHAGFWVEGVMSFTLRQCGAPLTRQLVRKHDWPAKKAENFIYDMAGQHWHAATGQPVPN